MTTRDLFAVIKNLTFCQQYVFGVGVVNLSPRKSHPGRNVRTIGTLIDELSAPENLQVEFIPDEEPCLLIKWSASCPNIAIPIGYLVILNNASYKIHFLLQVTILEKNPSRLTIISEPPTTAVDLSQFVRVNYGKSYDVKVAVAGVKSNATTAIVSYKVPHFLQPYKVRLTSQPDGTFMMYWREPFVPYYVGIYFYQIYVYPGRDLTRQHFTFNVNKPIFTFKGNLPEYTFMVGLRSKDGAFKSYLTDPIAKALDGEPTPLDELI